MKRFFKSPHGTQTRQICGDAKLSTVISLNQGWVITVADFFEKDILYRLATAGKFQNRPNWLRGASHFFFNLAQVGRLSLTL